MLDNCRKSMHFAKYADFFKFCRNVAGKKLEIFNFSDFILVLILFNFHIGVTPGRRTGVEAGETLSRSGM